MIEGATMQPGLYNMDCMEAMKQFPDKFFDLAIVDPPYGDAEMADNSIGGGTVWRIVQPVQDGTGSGRGSTDTNRPKSAGGVLTPLSPAQTEPGPKSTAKKLLRGTLPRERTTSRNSSASHAIKSFGAGTTSGCRRAGAF